MNDFCDSKKLNFIKNENIFLQEDETIEILHLKNPQKKTSNNFENLQIIQNEKNFKFGIDAVLLADFAKVKKNDFVIDFCTGTGIVPILMSAKRRDTKFAGIEIQQDCAKMATRSVALNNLENQINIIEENIQNFKNFEVFEKARQKKSALFNFNLKSNDKILELKAQCANVVTCNPPYFKVENNNATDSCSNFLNDLSKNYSNESVAISRSEILCSAEDVVSAANFLLKPNGRFYLICRPSRLSDFFILLEKYNFGVKKLRFVQSSATIKPSMFLLEAIKCARPELVIDAPLIIYKAQNIYSDEVNKIYCREALK